MTVSRGGIGCVSHQNCKSEMHRRIDHQPILAEFNSYSEFGESDMDDQIRAYVRDTKKRLRGLQDVKASFCAVQEQTKRDVEVIRELAEKGRPIIPEIRTSTSVCLRGHGPRALPSGPRASRRPSVICPSGAPRAAVRSKSVDRLAAARILAFMAGPPGQKGAGLVGHRDRRPRRPAVRIPTSPSVPLTPVLASRPPPWIALSLPT